MSGLTEMMEYITKYFPGVCNTIRAYREKALHILLKSAASHKLKAVSGKAVCSAENGTTVCVFLFSGKAVSLVTCSISY